MQGRWMKELGKINPQIRTTEGKNWFKTILCKFIFFPKAKRFNISAQNCPTL